MPAGYEKMRDEYIADGMDRKAAQGKAARIWNSQHPENPVGRGYAKKLKARSSKLKGQGARHKGKKR